MYVANLQIGNKYTDLRKTISIIIIDDEIEEFKKIEKSHTKWQLRENEYHKLILTNYCELHIIELPKAIKEYEKNRQDGMLQWMMFLNNPENREVVKIMDENKDIKEAKEELDKLRQDDILRRMALKAEIERMDYAQRVYEAERDGRKLGIKKGIEEGRKRGIKEGKIEGIKEAKLEDAKKMIKENIPIETIIKVTGLKKQEILN